MIWRKLRWILIGTCSRLWNWGTPQFHSNNLLASNAREREEVAACSRHACYMPIARGESAPKRSLSKIPSEYSLLLIPGIGAGRCGESSITIRE